jgi:predicted transcriptional regulator
VKSDAEELAERYADFKPGFRLLAVEEAAIPVFSVTASVLLQQRKPIVPINEYVLRCIHEGLKNPKKISDFLGLEMESLDNSITKLWQSDLIEVSNVNGNVDLRLTSEGNNSLNELAELVPVAQDIWFTFNRLSWKAVPVSTNKLIDQKSVENGDYVKIKPLKKDRPGVVDFPTKELNQAVKASMGIEMSDVDILVVKNVEQIDTKYQFCYLLVYESTNRGDHVVEVVFEGRINEEMGTAIDNLGGTAYLGMKFEIPASEVKGEIDFINSAISKINKPIVSLEDVTALRRKLAEPVESSLAIESEDLQKISQKTISQGLSELAIRFIDTVEHRPFMDQAIAEAKERLLITSPWVRNQVVRDDLMRSLYSAANRGVKIHIGYGISPNAEDCDARAVEQLKKFAANNKNVVVGCLGSTHAKILIWDDNSISGSFNWLSFRGDKDRTYRQEHSVLVLNQEKITNDLWKEQMEWIERSAGKFVAK